MVNKAGTVISLSVLFLTVILYSPSPSGFWNLISTLGGTFSTSSATSGPARSGGRPVRAQASPMTAAPAQAFLPSLTQGETRSLPSTLQPRGIEQARRACSTALSLAGSKASTRSAALFADRPTRHLPRGNIGGSFWRIECDAASAVPLG